MKPIEFKTNLTKSTDGFSYWINNILGSNLNSIRQPSVMLSGKIRIRLLNLRYVYETNKYKNN